MQTFKNTLKQRIMKDSITKIIRQKIEWNKAHKKNWERCLEQNEKGNTVFQEHALNEVCKLLEELGKTFTVKERETKGPFDNAIINKLYEISNDNVSELDIFIYRDMADFKINNKSYYFEKDDYLSEDELVKDMIKTMESLLR